MTSRQLLLVWLLLCAAFGCSTTDRDPCGCSGSRSVGGYNAGGELFSRGEGRLVFDDDDVPLTGDHPDRLATSPLHVVLTDDGLEVFSEGPCEGCGIPPVVDAGADADAEPSDAEPSDATPDAEPADADTRRPEPPVSNPYVAGDPHLVLKLTFTSDFATPGLHDAALALRAETCRRGVLTPGRDRALSCVGVDGVTLPLQLALDGWVRVESADTPRAFTTNLTIRDRGSLTLSYSETQSPTEYVPGEEKCAYE